MESIPEIDSLSSQGYTSDDDSDYSMQRLEKDKRKKEQLMAQRLRGRIAKTQRLRKESDTNYGDIQSSSDEEDDLAEYWNQIKDKKPLTITDPNMTRFMMTLEDAVDLVLYAFEHANQGDLFVQKAPSQL